MNKLLEAYKESGIDGVLEYIDSLHNWDDDYGDYNQNATDEAQAAEEITEKTAKDRDEAAEDTDEAYLEKVIELEGLLYQNYGVYDEFPQTLLSALHGKELLNEPHIHEWYHYIRDTINREPVLPLWKQPEKLKNTLTNSSHEEFILGLHYKQLRRWPCRISLPMITPALERDAIWYGEG